MMRAHTSGSFFIVSKQDGNDVTPRGRKARALLAYLVSNPTEKIAKGRIVGLLWGDRGEPQARSSLRQVLVELRACLNSSGETICSDRERVWLRPDMMIEDLPQSSGRHKDAFEDLDGISAQFDEWLSDERSRREKARIATLKSQAEVSLLNDRGDHSLVLVRQIQAIDPHDEDALRLGMEAEFQRGHAGAIVELYRGSAALLEADLGVQPSHETLALRDELIWRLTGAGESARMRETDQNFFSRRAGEEAEAAVRAKTSVVREIHELLANRYEELSASSMRWKSPE